VLKLNNANTFGINSERFSVFGDTQNHLMLRNSIFPSVKFRMLCSEYELLRVCCAFSGIV
jgi:hypothetical protein